MHNRHEIEIITFLNQTNMSKALISISSQEQSKALPAKLSFKIQRRPIRRKQKTYRKGQMQSID